MITRADLEKINLQPVPYRQMLVANFLLRWNYRIPRKTEIVIVGEERIPYSQPVIFVMNHTDFYNYWLFMYQLFTPFTRAAEQTFATNFSGATDLMMDQINALLDPEYQFDPNAVQRTGVERFV